MPTDSITLNRGSLLATKIMFVVNEGPFFCQATDIIKYADRVVLHAKHLPISMGGRLWGASKISIQFYVGGHIFYRAPLGRHKWRLIEESHFNYGELMWTWLEVEGKKRRGLERQMMIHRVSIQQVTETQVIDTFDRMSDLEVLQRLNDRTRKFIKEHNTESTMPFSEDIKYKIAS